MTKKNDESPRAVCPRKMERWLNDLDAIIDEMSAAGDGEMAALAEHIDDVAMAIEARSRMDAGAGPEVIFTGNVFGIKKG